jgi:tetratricopeptide (TPR) repeat protein
MRGKHGPVSAAPKTRPESTGPDGLDGDESVGPVQRLSVAAPPATTPTAVAAAATPVPQLPDGPDADAFALLDALRRRMDEHGAQGRRTTAQVSQLADSVAALVGEQRSRSRWINMNSFVAYVIFTVIVGAAFFALYRSRASELLAARDTAVERLTAATKRADAADSKLAAREKTDTAAWEVYNLLEAGKRKDAVAKLDAIPDGTLSRTERAVLAARAHETAMMEVEAALKTANANFRAGRYTEIIGPLEAGLINESTGPHAASMHYLLGVSYAKNNDLDKAVPHLRAALATDTEHDDTGFQLASALDRAGEYAKARAEYNQFATAHPQLGLAVYAMRRSATLARMPAVVAPKDVTGALTAPGAAPVAPAKAAPAAGPSAPTAGVPARPTLAPGAAPIGAPGATRASAPTTIAPAVKAAPASGAWETKAPAKAWPAAAKPSAPPTAPTTAPATDATAPTSTNGAWLRSGATDLVASNDVVPHDLVASNDTQTVVPYDLVAVNDKPAGKQPSHTVERDAPKRAPTELQPTPRADSPAPSVPAPPIDREPPSTTPPIEREPAPSPNAPTKPGTTVPRERFIGAPPAANAVAYDLVAINDKPAGKQPSHTVERDAPKKTDPTQLQPGPRADSPAPSVPAPPIDREPPSTTPPIDREPAPSPNAPNKPGTTVPRERFDAPLSSAF